MYRLTALSLAVALVAWTGTPQAQGRVEAAVLTAERAWVQALVDADLAALGAVYADELRYVHSGGNVETKAEFIERIRSGGLKYRRVQHVEPAVHVYGNAASVAGTLDVEVDVDGERRTPKVRFLHVWVRRDGRWQLAAHQTTPVPAP